jgi:hypothetical protein
MHHVVRTRTPLVTCALALVAALTVLGGRRVRAAGDSLPAQLSDQEFWTLSSELSEPNGSFRSDNLLSNEIYYPAVMADLVRQVRPGSVYLGVGPEQNFNYIVALRPKMVFITDIRRGNLQAQLMYKALFELSSDRADFISRLFSKPRPAGLTADSSAGDIMDAFWDVPTSPESVYTQNLQAIDNLLTRGPHHLPLSQDDLDGIEYVYHSFYWFGPSINYNSSTNGSNGRGFGNMADYASLMKARDENGSERSYLASEQSFAFMKSLEAHNLLVPVVGNFGGPKALRGVGKYVRDHQALIGAFYLSNVEQYLRQEGIWTTFCANVATMPIDDTSTFIRSGQAGFGFGGGGLRNSLGSMKEETQSCGAGS